MAQRNFGLDLLRAVAILIVLANHAVLGFFNTTGHIRWGQPWTAASLSSVISIEWLFVLSGFLIGAMSIRSFERESTFWARAKSFWLRRWFRTVPTYMLFLVVNILLVAWRLAPGQYTVAHFFFAQNLWQAESIPFFFAEAWSLAVDEWFYLALPLLVGLFMLGRRQPKTAFFLATAALILIPMIARMVAAPPHATVDGDRLLNWDMRFRRITLYHLDATGWGVLAAAANRWLPEAWSASRGPKALAGLGLMVLGVLSVQDLYWGGALWDTLPRLANGLTLTLMSVGTVLALPWIANLAPVGGWIGRAVDALSLYSYTIYLAHMPILDVLVLSLDDAQQASAPHLVALMVAWLALVLTVSALVYHKFEKPVADLRDRYTTRVDASPFKAPAKPAEP